MAVAAGALINLPAWATNWTAETVKHAPKFLSSSQGDLLGDIAETIIPTTDTPGAKALNVHQFIQKVVADCYDSATQNNVRNGLTLVEEQAQKSFGKPFAQGDTAQRMALLTQLSKSDEAAQKEFYSLLKGLTVRGYMNSEYVMTNLTHYQMIPGHYYGCVPVPTKAVSQTK